MSHRHHRPVRRERRSPGAELPTICSIADAAMFAFDLPEAVGASDEVIVIVDDAGRIQRIVIDPLVPGAGRMMIPRRRARPRGSESVLHVVIRPLVLEEEPCSDDVIAFGRLKAAHEHAGRRMLDLMLTDGERVQSLSLALDPDSPWLHHDGTDGACEA